MKEWIGFVAQSDLGLDLWPKVINRRPLTAAGRWTRTGLPRRRTCRARRCQSLSRRQKWVDVAIAERRLQRERRPQSDLNETRCHQVIVVFVPAQPSSATRLQVVMETGVASMWWTAAFSRPSAARRTRAGQTASSHC